MNCSRTSISCPNSSQNIGLYSTHKQNSSSTYQEMEHTGLYNMWNRRICSTAWKSRHSSKMVNSNLPHFTELEVTEVNIPTRTETLANGAVYAPPNRPLLVQNLTKLTQYTQHFILAGDYNAKHKMWNFSKNKRQGPDSARPYPPTQLRNHRSACPYSFPNKL
jgi:hypothetical protein